MDDVNVIGRSVEELIVNLRAVLLRFMDRGLSLAAYKLVLFAKEIKWYGKLYSGTAVRHDPGRVRELVGDAPTSDGRRADEVSAGDELDAFVTALHGGKCGTTASVDGTSTEGNEPNEKRRVAVDSNG